MFPSFHLGSMPVITSIERGPSVEMLVRGRGAGSSQYVLQGATNLMFQSWTTQQVWWSEADGQILFMDLGATNHEVRYYRMSEP